ncbi:hypothetical protein BH24CHL5_BH24CHL5_10630 [soil metagenome]
MIVVLGRPGLTHDGALDRPAGRIALAAAAAGGRVELVGTVGDDAEGDNVALELGRAGVGHAALLRDPAAATPGPTAEAGDDAPRLPRLDAADVELGLRYLADCHVLVLAEPMPPPALAVALDAAAYHGAALIVVTAPTGAAAEQPSLPDEATVLEMPDHDEGAFAELVGRYAALLESGRSAPEAWHDALADSGWEHASG